MPYGFGLVFLAVHYILRFADRYYMEHRTDYTTQQQTVIDNLITAANALEAAISPVIFP